MAAFIKTPPYSNLDSFQADTEPFTDLTNLVIWFLKIKSANIKSRCFDLGSIIDALRMIGDRAWQLDVYIKHPAIAKAYGSSFSSALSTASYLAYLQFEMCGKSVDLKKDIRNVWALSALNTACTRNLREHEIEILFRESKSYRKLKPKQQKEYEYLLSAC